MVLVFANSNRLSFTLVGGVAFWAGVYAMLFIAHDETGVMASNIDRILRDYYPRSSCSSYLGILLVVITLGPLGLFRIETVCGFLIFRRKGI